MTLYKLTWPGYSFMYTSVFALYFSTAKRANAAKDKLLPRIGSDKVRHVKIEEIDVPTGSTEDMAEWLSDNFKETLC